jgi:hypothetical protein
VAPIGVTSTSRIPSGIGGPRRVVARRAGAWPSPSSRIGFVLIGARAVRHEATGGRRGSHVRLTSSMSATSECATAGSRSLREVALDVGEADVVEGRRPFADRPCGTTARGAVSHGRRGRDGGELERVIEQCPALGVGPTISRQPSPAASSGWSRSRVD